MSRQFTEEKDQILGQLVKSLLDVFNFQQYVNTSLEELKAEAESDLEAVEAMRAQDLMVNLN